MPLAEFLLARNAEQEERCRLLLDSDLLPHSLSVRRTLKIALAECEAKRQIIAWLGSIAQAHIGANGEFSRDADIALRLLAAVYADHPQFQPEWRP
jgi:hypothetical protein